LADGPAYALDPAALRERRAADERFPYNSGRLLADALGPSDVGGTTPFPAFLLDMERVFERYVTRGVTEAFGPDRARGTGVSRRAPCLEIAMGQGDLRVVGMGQQQRLQHVGGKDVEIARRAKLLRDPFELGLDLVQVRVGDHIGKDRDGGAQTPETDAHLVQRLGVASTHRALIGDDLPEGALGDGAEGVSAARCGQHEHAQQDRRKAQLGHDRVENPRGPDRVTVVLAEHQDQGRRGH